ETCSAASKMLGFIIRSSRTFKDPALLKSLYFAFVASKLEYASLVWYPYYASHNAAIEKVQRRFLKYISFKLDDAYPQRNIEYNILLERHGISSLARRRELFSAKFGWKLIDGKIDCPTLLGGLNFHVPRFNARYNSTFLLPRARTNHLRRAPLTK